MERISHPIFVGEFEEISWEKSGYVGEFGGKVEKKVDCNYE